MADVGEVDALICDPPYGARTHKGHRHSDTEDGSDRRAISYANWTPEQAREFVLSWAPKCNGWMAIMSCSQLAKVYEDAYEDCGRISFAPVACVTRGMTVRMAGDGPSNWTVYLSVSRPRTAKMKAWGALNGAYIVTRKGEQHIGGKPISLMNAIIRDYTKPGDLVCDPCAGMATTAIACSSLGRRFVGSEIDPETYAKAQKRLAGGQQIDMWGGVA